MQNVGALFALSCVTLLGGCNAESSPVLWQMSQASSNGVFRADLSCETAPLPGDFQKCLLQLKTADGKPVNNASVTMEGGMPAHGHGLPTAPAAIALDNDGNFRIDGLQYSMIGAWLLGFLVKTPDSQDKVVFDFVI